MTETAHKRGCGGFNKFARFAGISTALLEKKSIEAAREREIKVQHQPWAQGGPLSACFGAGAPRATLGCQHRQLGKVVWMGLGLGQGMANTFEMTTSA
jgi:hypothetical protein